MARKSKKVDFVNVNDLPSGFGAQVPVPVKAVCYRAGLYARLSEETEENRERATVETQMELLRKFVAEREDMVIGKEYADISCTGTNFERPGFEAMVRDMRDGVIDCIVVKDLSRLGRDYVETGNYIERVFPFFGVRFIAVTDGYDSEKPGGELMMPLKNMVNELYVKDLSRKMRTAHRAYWRNGEYSSGAVPYGYVNVERRLYPDERVKGTVQEIFRLFLEGCSLKEIARRVSRKEMNPKAYKMLRFGHEVPEGFNTEWNYVTVRTILTNYAYVGASVHNRYKRVAGKQVKIPEEEWIVVEGTHEALVGREDYEKVQKLLAGNAERFHSTHGENGYDHARFNLLGKKIVCADCGKVMGFRTEGARHDKKFYRCKTYLQSTHGSCTNHKVSLEDVNQAVFGTVAAHMRLCIEAEETVRRMNADDRNLRKYDFYGKEAERIRKELQRETEVKAGIFEDYRDGLIDEEQYAQISGQYAEKIRALTARLGEVQKARAEYSSRYCVDRNWKAVVEGCLDMQSLTREMVEAFVDKVAVHEGGDVEVYLKYDDVLEDLLRIRAEREAV